MELTATFFLVWSAPKSKFFVHFSNNVMSNLYYIKTARTSFSRCKCQSFTPEKHVLTFKTTTSLAHLQTEVPLWLLNYCGTDGLRHLVKSLMAEQKTLIKELGSSLNMFKRFKQLVKERGEKISPLNILYTSLSSTFPDSFNRQL